jgi:2-methylisocitrate lyase-like PEP mutase family enzyme
MKILEAFNGISAMLVDKSDYDGIWVSSLTHSSSKGLPDNELLSLKDRADLIQEIKNVSNKPMIVDIDTGGGPEHFAQNIKWIRDAGAWAVVMEDKCYPKQNSLLEDGKHKLEDVDKFCEKIKIAKSVSGEMKVIARLESLIAKHSVYEALIRAEAYVNAGVDGILIHSKEKVEAKDLMEFSFKFREQYPDVLLIAIPTTYTLPDNHPFDITINANQMFRASLKGMKNYLEGKEDLSSVQEIFDMVGH